MAVLLPFIMRLSRARSNISITLMLDLQQTRSNASHVLLTSVVANNSGKYGCEASADAPSFHTQIMFKEMMVVGEYREMQASNMKLCYLFLTLIHHVINV